MSVAEYYHRVDFSPLWEIDSNFLKFRQVKILMSDGGWMAVRRRINSPSKLKQVIVNAFGKHYPFKVYYTCSQWLNPTSLRGKIVISGYQVADNLLIGQNQFVFDIDTDVEENGRRLIRLIKKGELGEDISLKYVIFSGSGIHVCVNRPLHLPEDWRLRESYVEQKNRELIEKVKARGIKVDDCTINPRQVTKVPLTYDAEHGVPCQLLDERLTGLNKLLKVVKQEKELEGFEPSPTYVWGITNNILGTKGLYCIFLRFRSEPLFLVRHIVEGLIERYHLSDFYLFKRADGGYSAICLKAVDGRRLSKILAFNRDYQNAFLKFHRNVLTNDDLDQYLETVNGYPTGMISKGHSNFLGRLGIQVEGRVGSSKVKVFMARRV
jgi:hypothetical protein